MEKGGQKYFLYAQMSIQCVECGIIEIYLLLVAGNLLKYILLWFIFLVLRHIALLIARNWSLAWTWSIQEIQVHFHAQRGHEIGNYCFIYGESISNQRIEAWFYWWRKPGYPKKATDHSQATDNLFSIHVQLRFFFNQHKKKIIFVFPVMPE